MFPKTGNLDFQFFDLFCPRYLNKSKSNIIKITVYMTF